MLEGSVSVEADGLQHQRQADNKKMYGLCIVTALRAFGVNLHAKQQVVSARHTAEFLTYKGSLMPTMSDNRRRRIVSKQRKLENAKKRAAKVAKKARNAD